MPVVGRKLIRGSCQLGVFDLAIREKWAETIEVDPGDFGRLSGIISIATDEHMNSYLVSNLPKYARKYSSFQAAHKIGVASAATFFLYNH